MRLPVDGLAEPMVCCVLLSASAPECSGALFARRARRADACFMFYRRQPPSDRVRYSHDGLAEPIVFFNFIDVSRMLALVMLMPYRMRPPSFWVHCSADRS